MNEDDYMSEDILKQCDDVRPGLIYSKSLKRSYDIKKKQENSMIKPLRVLEEERREAGLNAKLPESNKGFELLRKMGYTPGLGIGKSEAGPSDPLAIVKKSNRVGLGFGKRLKPSPQTEASTDDFRAMLKRKREISDLKKTYYKLQRMCFIHDDNDLISKPLYKWFWPGSDDSDDTDSDSDESNEEESKISDENELERRTNCMGQYLREKYLYCQYCQCTFTDDNDMVQNCPGPTKLDHEDNPCNNSPTSDSDL